MFEITGSDIASLSEEDLRSLVGLLCEAELRRNGDSTSGVTWGGHQNAMDGGLDVRVVLDKKLSNPGFVPLSVTGFQSKAEDMPRAKITNEMRPNGILRPVIKELSEQNGAYIIVSSKGSVSDSSLRERRKAMRDAIVDLPAPDSLYIEFYDRNRLASWVRNHGSLIAWVRERVGRPIPGWRSFEPWAYPSEGIDAEYLLDDSIIIRIPGSDDKNGHQPLDGINEIRRRLSRPKGIVRLVGLSGVGKTRFAQALFDNRLGEHPLDPSIVYYTNLSDDPSPSPVNHASALVASQERAILVIDNCTPELHRRLSEVGRSVGSAVSVLSIEYDIREDQPEGTDVFEILPSSTQLIESLLAKRYANLSEVDIRTVAEFSGGNARVAIALAETVEQGESISGLRDEELFARLFHQRHQPNDSLLHSAQICSLVYSFDVESDPVEGASELSILAKAAGVSNSTLFRDIAELKRRHLIQQRGVWRAVLPHAIANRLGAIALQNMPYESLRAFVNSCSERLLRSFSRRLGYLHDSPTAKRLVAEWLSANGYLSELPRLNDFGQGLLENVAPVAPDAVLAALEKHLSPQCGSEALKGCQRYRGLIRSLAYEQDQFDRALELLIVLNEQEQSDSDANHAKEEFQSLFQIHLSGTHATIEQRVAWVDRLLRSGSFVRNELGLSALDGLLEACQFSGFRGFDFGALSRDYGYWPANRAEIVKWFSMGISLCIELESESPRFAVGIRRVLGGKLRGLWTQARMFDELEAASKSISERRFWPEGWLEACSIYQYDSKAFDAVVLKRTKDLLNSLKPSDVVGEVRSLILSRGTNAYWDFEYEDDCDFGNILAQRDAAAYTLGKRTAVTPSILDQILSEVLEGDSHGDLSPFARGLIDGANDPKLMWSQIVARFLTSSKSHSAVSVLCTCLAALNLKAPTFADEFLEKAVEDPALGQWFPALQRCVPVSHQTVDRLKRSLALGQAPLQNYNPLSIPHEALPPSDFEDLVMLLLAKENSFSQAVDLVGIRIFCEKRSQGSIPEPIRRAGRSLFEHFYFSRSDRNNNFHLSNIASECLKDVDGQIVIEGLFGRLRSAFAEFAVSAYGADNIILSLMNAQPIAALNGLFPVGSASDDKVQRAEWGIARIRGFSPRETLSEDLLLWCERDSEFRFQLLASLITPFKRNEDGQQIWTDFALSLLRRSPNKIAVLEKYARALRPRSWSGSRIPTVELNATLLNIFLDDSDESIAQFARDERERIRSFVAIEKEQEAKFDKQTDERFE